MTIKYGTSNDNVVTFARITLADMFCKYLFPVHIFLLFVLLLTDLQFSGLFACEKNNALKTVLLQ
jgi:hypothetical protein